MTGELAQDVFWGFWILLHLVVWIVVLWNRAQRQDWGSLLINLIPPIAVWTIWAQIGDWVGQLLSAGFRLIAAALQKGQMAEKAARTQKQRQQQTRRYIRVLELERQGIAIEAACEAEEVDPNDFKEWRRANVTDPQS